MKKLAKILLVVLVVAALLGTLAFAVMADTTEGEESTAWQPAEGSGITYAVWSSKAEYESGAVEPLFSSTETTWSTATTKTEDWKKISTNTAYVVFFADITMPNEQVNILTLDVTKVKNITFNLNHKTLTTPKDYVLYLSTDHSQGVTATFENGTVNAHKIVWRRADTLVFDGVTLTTNYLGHTSGGNLTIKNSTCTLKGQNPFFLGPVAKGNVATLQFLNSTLTFTGSLLTSHYYQSNYNKEGIFEILYNEKYCCDFDIIIDKNTKFITPTAGDYIFMCLNESVALPEKYNINIYVESGAEIFGNKYFPLKNTWKKYDRTAYGYVNGETVVAKEGVDPFEINVTMVSDLKALTNPAGFTTKTFSDGTKFMYDDAFVPYTMPADATLAVFAGGEEWYKAGLAPFGVYYDTKTIDHTFTRALPRTSCVVLNDDITFTHTSTSTMYLLADNADVTFILNNHTFTSSKILKVANDSAKASLTFKNGKVACNNQFHFKATHTLTLDNVVYDGYQLGYNSGGNLTVRNSEVTLSCSCAFFFGPTTAAGSKVLIENSNIYCTSNELITTPSKIGDYGYAGIFEMMANGTTINMEIRIDKTSSIVATNVMDPILFVVWQSKDGIGYENGANYRLDLIIEPGAILGGISGELKYAYRTSDQKKEWATENPACPANIFVAAPGDQNNTPLVEGEDYEVKAFINGDNLIYSTTYNNIVNYKPDEGDTFAVWPTKEHCDFGLAPTVYYDDIYASVTSTLNNHSYIVVYEDINLVFDVDKQTGFVGPDRELTIDLNNHKLTANDGIGVSSNSYKSTLSLLNGELVSNANISARAGNKFYLYDIYLKATALTYFTTADSIIVEKSTLELWGTTPISCASARNGITPEMKFIDTDIILSSNSLSSKLSGVNSYAGNAIITAYYNSNSPFNWNIVFDKDSSITYTGKVQNPIWFALVHTLSKDTDGDGVAETHIPYPDAMPKVIFEEGFAVSANIMPDFTYIQDAAGSGYKFTKMPANPDVFVLEDTDGEPVTNYHGVLTPITNYHGANTVDAYALTKTTKAAAVGSNLQANLTLYSNFELNFYIQGNVTGIFNNGVKLTAENGKVQGRDKYVIGIPANKVAEALKLLIEIDVDGQTHIYPATYSVLAYANQIVSGNFAADDKELVCAAMYYAQAAYEATVTGSKFAFDNKGVEVREIKSDAAPNQMSNEAIRSAQLGLNSGFKFRFNLKETFSGTLKIDDYTWNVTNGKVGTVTYVELDYRAYQLVKELKIIAITAETETEESRTIETTYSLAQYVANSNNYLTNPLYTYCVIANEYKAAH